MHYKNQKKIHLLITTSYLIAILFLSVYPISLSGLPVQLDPEQLILHALEYLILGLLVSATLISHRIKNTLVKAFLISFLYGLSMEIIQYFLPYRSFSFLDIGANTLGILLGIGLYLKISNKK